MTNGFFVEKETGNAENARSRRKFPLVSVSVKLHVYKELNQFCLETDKWGGNLRYHHEEAHFYCKLYQYWFSMVLFFIKYTI